MKKKTNQTQIDLLAPILPIANQILIAGSNDTPVPGPVRTFRLKNGKRGS